LKRNASFRGALPQSLVEQSLYPSLPQLGYQSQYYQLHNCENEMFIEICIIEAV
jgi:hypothetical protein